MTDRDQALAQALQAANAAWARQLPARLQEIGAALQSCEQQPGERQHLDVLLNLLHRLSGSAGSFGFGELGLRATELEILLAEYRKQPEGKQEEFARIADGIRKMVQTALPQKDEPRPATSAETVPPPSERLIYLVHDNPLLAKDLASQLEYFGYDVVITGGIAQLEQAIAKRTPAAVIMDLAFPSGIFAGAAEVARIRQRGSRSFAVIFLSTRSSFEARLATVRAGADGYFAKPLDMVALVERLDALTVQEARSPYRILVIDSDNAAAEAHARALTAAGMDVHVLRQLPDMLQALAEYRPELILIDVALPDCDSVTLARMIRQDDIYLDVPIVFLSDAASIEGQLAAIASGVDDFLPKPITPAHLASALSSRASRYRKLRALIMRDSLTGLYNHSAVKENLAREMARASRTRQPLTLGMIDIDHFKKVNDTYGHPVGDQVIRALSRLLQQRLRRGDLIGRYGGEEFAVIMPNTDAGTATMVLNRIRESFANIRHHSELEDFTATFSAGVAELDAHTDAQTLFRLADDALYEAKRQGRNCVVSANSPERV